ncbi:hypothetical protein BV898_08514 [Hypsibius exemplaris]|uniref:Uncharacterized protein n=1 Tax=Hypsibius exemplaris TaxID=2072580 RepID=A0A1W0WQC3_HYPEX|nr:hypothetical protein BV898_08514 [Hypsibius exemplaris]
MKLIYICIILVACGCTVVNCYYPWNWNPWNWQYRPSRHVAVEIYIFPSLNDFLAWWHGDGTFSSWKNNVPDGDREDTTTTARTTEVPISSTPFLDKKVVVDYFCYYYTDLTYYCKTKCDYNDGERTLATSTIDTQLKYYDMNCTEQVEMNQTRWSGGPQSILSGRYIDTSKEKDILATCAFFTGNEFACDGVSSCTSSNNENRCGSAAPWSGSYIGSPQTGFTLNGTIVRTFSNPT